MPRVDRVVEARNRIDSLQSRGRMAPRRLVKTLAVASDPDAASTEEGGNHKRSEEAKEAGIDAKRYSSELTIKEKKVSIAYARFGPST
jgi:hypothetical protein